MTHYMKLNPRPFDSIAMGRKTIELRLYDEKRRQIKAGDTIVFTNTSDPGRQLRAAVKKLHIFRDFDELYKALPLNKCGYLPEELPHASPRDMEEYYSPAQQRQWGAVGIEIVLIDAGGSSPPEAHRTGAK